MSGAESVVAAGGNGFFPPVQYSPLWAVLALAVIGILVLFYVLVPLLTRVRKQPEQPSDTSGIPSVAPAELREKYAELIAEVEALHDRGELSLRTAHQRLSLLLRFFAWESSGIRAPQMTLSDLREARALPLSDAVEQLYPGAFAEIERGTVAEASEMAREVVRSWT